MVLRGVPTSITDDEIGEELSLNFPVKNVRRMRMSRDRKPCPLVFVELDKTTEAKEIFDLTNIFYIKIKVESLKRSSEVTQCHRCQGFRHAANCCKLPPKCVKCGKGHLTTECQLPKKAAAKCANCGEGHPASYRGCTAFPKKAANTATRRPPAEITNPATRSSGVSYARVTVQKNSANTPAASETTGNENSDKTQIKKTLCTLISHLAQISASLQAILEAL